jgi:hypothetical protein
MSRFSLKGPAAYSRRHLREGCCSRFGKRKHSTTAIYALDCDPAISAKGNGQQAVLVAVAWLCVLTIGNYKAVVDGHEMEDLAKLQWIALPLSLQQL